jgi:hypothetical protein
MAMILVEDHAIRKRNDARSLLAAFGTAHLAARDMGQAAAHPTPRHRMQRALRQLVEQIHIEHDENRFVAAT